MLEFRPASCYKRQHHPINNATTGATTTGRQRTAKQSRASCGSRAALLHLRCRHHRCASDLSPIPLSLRLNFVSCSYQARQRHCRYPYMFRSRLLRRRLPARSLRPLRTPPPPPPPHTYLNNQLRACTVAQYCRYGYVLLLAAPFRQRLPTSADGASSASSSCPPLRLSELPYLLHQAP